MAKTLNTETAAGWTTKNAQLIAEEVDDNFIALEQDAEAVELPVGTAVLLPRNQPLPSKWVVLAGQQLSDTEYPALASYYTVTGGFFNVQNLLTDSPDPSYYWCIKAL